MRTLPPDARSSGKGQFARAVGAFVPKVTAAAFEKFGFHSAEIMASWETIVGADLARLTRPETIKWPRGARSHGDTAEEGARSAGATLIVASDPAFALDISYRHQEIIDRINRYFGYRAIGQLKVHQVPRDAKAGPKAPAALKAPTVGITVSPGDLSAALDALGRSVAASGTR